MKLIDSHAHLTPKWFKDPLKIIEESKKSLAGIVVIGLDPDEYQYLIDLVAAEPTFIRIALGISPTYVHKIKVEKAFQEIEEKIQKVHAVGEIGLDYYRVRDKALHEQQEQLFLRGIQLANAQNQPLVIHSRGAEAKVVQLLSRYAETMVVLHCFGGVNQVSLACANGFFISIPTAVTYRQEFREVAMKVSLDHLLIETDSPFLSPIRGRKKNTPKNVKYAAREIARLRELSLADIANVTTKNAQTLFWRTF
ncbi:MAG: TatD family hydrolase [Candidatus Heimdallarchaeota archaeon]